TGASPPVGPYRTPRIKPPATVVPARSDRYPSMVTKTFPVVLAVNVIPRPTITGVAVPVVPLKLAFDVNVPPVAYVLFGPVGPVKPVGPVGPVPTAPLGPVGPVKG